MTDPHGWWGHRPGELGEAIADGSRPWLIPDQPMMPYRGPEPQEAIDRCLGCALPPERCKGDGTRCTLCETRGSKKQIQ